MVTLSVHYRSVLDLRVGPWKPPLCSSGYILWQRHGWVSCTIGAEQRSQFSFPNSDAAQIFVSVPRGLVVVAVVFREGFCCKGWMWESRASLKYNIIWFIQWIENTSLVPFWILDLPTSLTRSASATPKRSSGLIMSCWGRGRVHWRNRHLASYTVSWSVTQLISQR